MGFICHDLQKTRERTTAAEGRISDIEDKLTPLISDTQITARLARANKLKTDNIENRLRRNNVRIAGLPEKTEGRDPTEFVEKWLLEHFGKKVFTPLFTVEHAHRVPPGALRLGHPPRTLLARLLNCKDKEIVLPQARERRNIQYNGVRVSFYPDYSAEVQRCQAEFADVKKRLQQLHATYAMLFLARLRIVTGGQSHIFELATEASAWLDANANAFCRAGRGEERKLMIDPSIHRGQ